MARLPSDICRMLHAVLTGKGPQPDTYSLNDRLRGLISPSRRRYLDDPDDLLGGYCVYVLSDEAHMRQIEAQPLPGVRRMWEQFLFESNEGYLSKKFYTRIGRIAGQLQLTKASPRRAREIAEVIKEHFRFRINEEAPDPADGREFVRVWVNHDESEREDPVLRDADILKIGEVVRDSLGNVTRSELANALAAVMPPNLWLPPRAEQADLDEPLSHDDEDSESFGDTLPGKQIGNSNSEASEVLGHHIWGELSTVEQHVWTGYMNGMSWDTVTRWCEMYQVPAAPKDRKRASGIFTRVKNKLEKVDSASEDYDCFGKALLCVVDGPMEDLLKEKPPPAG